MVVAESSASTVKTTGCSEPEICRSALEWRLNYCRLCRPQEYHRQYEQVWILRQHSQMILPVVDDDDVPAAPPAPAGDLITVKKERGY